MHLNAYFICATPRTGSTLLCSLLKSSGVAGVPESYFRKQDFTKWSAAWGLLGSSGESVAFSDYLNAAIVSGSTKNSVFAARIMWGTLDELTENLKAVFPECNGADIDLLYRAFGNIRFIYLKREDYVAQAVSRLKAEQTDIWHVTDKKNITSEHAYHYDFKKIDGFVKEAAGHNSFWSKWFNSNGVEPHKISYENLCQDPTGEVRKILDFLALDLPPHNALKAKNMKMSDNLNASWIERYKTESASQRKWSE